MKKFIVLLLLLCLLGSGGFLWWSQAPILPAGHAPVAFTIKPGSGTRAATEQIEAAGVPVQPMLLELLARLTGSSARIKAGSYEIEGGTTPRRLIQQLVRGEFAQHALTVIEGWTFGQMRQAINAHKSLSHDTASLSDAELMAKISPDFKLPEGLFFPDTYLFAKGASDLQVYRQAHGLMLARLNEAWQARVPGLPYKTPYEALIMASIVEKETGLHSERDMIASVFVNRLRIGMMLQTDPTVIYGMGQQFQGNLRKRDLQSDTPYNTYTRAGLPPTPIALPGVAALKAALNPAQSDMLYFVSRGNGSSHFSGNLDDHNRAVNKFQRGGKPGPAGTAAK
ncbi:MAG: endolytic transglycosylase MltG [Lacisediminimonas sp.]|nr:endolytic transglycosylase MltG [Lacisediminimonas sp.]